MQDLFEDVRDFVILHYHATRRDDSEFWNRCRTMEVPASLTRKMQLFRAKGRCFRQGAELFATTSWVSVMLGQNFAPDDYEPAVDALDEDKVGAALEQMRIACLETAKRLPTHAQFIAHACASQDPAAARPGALAGAAGANRSASPFAGFSS